MKRLLVPDMQNSNKEQKKDEYDRIRVMNDLNIRKRGQGGGVRINTLDQKNINPNDLRIRFDEGPHHYYVDDELVKTSVSGFIDKFYPAFNKQKTLSNMFTKCPKGQTETFTLPFSTAKKATNKYAGHTKKNVDDAWEFTNQCGTRMHACIEHFYNTVFDKDYLSLTKEEKLEIITSCPSYVESENKLTIEQFLKVSDRFYNEGWHIYRVEWNVHWKEYSIAGGIDAVFERKNDNDEPEYMIVDWKRTPADLNANYGRSASTKKFFYPVTDIDNTTFNHYCFQINTYSVILKDYGLKVTRRVVSQFNPNSSLYILHEMISMENKVLKCLQIWKRHLHTLEELKLFLSGKQKAHNSLTRASAYYPSFPYPVYSPVKIN